jgi:peptidyl-prolyl cis-trans isomerase SurA
VPYNLILDLLSMTHRVLSTIFSVTLLSLMSLGIPEATAQSKGEILMTVGGTTIDKEEFLHLITKGKTVDPSAAILTKEEFDENLEQFITFKLKVKEAESLGMHQSEEFFKEFESFKESLIAPFLIKNSVEEGELRKVYGRMQEIVRASHILFQFPPNASTEDSLSILKIALKVKSELENGGDFSALALAYSDDPSAKVNKGDLGYFTSLQMVQEFEEAAYTLPVGEISGPVKTDFGYHIIQVNGRQSNPGDVQVSHILVRFDPENSSQEENARRRISDLYQEIQKESTVWEELVTTYSEDLATNKSGGILPWFGVGTMIPDFELAAFSLTEIGEISPPIKTAYGYHILRLEGKRPLESFEALEQGIKSKIFRSSKSGMIQSQVTAMQKARYGFKENEEGISNLAREISATTIPNFGNTLQEKGLTSTLLFSIANRSFTAADLWKFMQTEEITPRGSGTFLELWLNRFISQTLAKAEESDLEANNKAYQQLLKEYRDGILLFSLTNQEVWQKGLIDSLGQRAYYAQNRPNYQWKTRIQAYLVQVNDASKLEIARKYLRNSDFDPSTFAAFEADYRANFPNAFGIESGTFEYEEHPILSDVDLTQTYQERLVEGETYLLVLGTKIPPAPRKFEEARGLVIRDYQAALEKDLIKKLKNKYPVQINNGVKEKAFAALNN